MLGIDQQPVITGPSVEFRHISAGQTAPQPNLLPPLKDRALESIHRKIVLHGWRFRAVAIPERYRPPLSSASPITTIRVSF